MSRQVLTTDVVIPAGGYLKVERRLKKGQVVELNATEIAEIGGGNLRSTTSAIVHDQLGEAFAVAN